MNLTLRKIACAIYGHTDLRIFLADSAEGSTRYVCMDCLKSWKEYDGQLWWHKEKAPKKRAP